MTYIYVIAYQNLLGGSVYLDRQGNSTHSFVKAVKFVERKNALAFSAKYGHIPFHVQLHERLNTRPIKSRKVNT